MTYEFKLGYVLEWDTGKILPSLSEDSYFVTVHVDNNGDGHIDFLDPSLFRGRMLVESSKFEEGGLMIFEGEKGMSMIFNVSSNKEVAFGLLIADKLQKKSFVFGVEE